MQVVIVEGGAALRRAVRVKAGGCRRRLGPSRGPVRIERGEVVDEDALLPPVE